MCGKFGYFQPSDNAKHTIISATDVASKAILRNSANPNPPMHPVDAKHLDMLDPAIETPSYDRTSSYERSNNRGHTGGHTFHKSRSSSRSKSPSKDEIKRLHQNSISIYQAKEKFHSPYKRESDG